jgi:DNA-binding NtrC family response regulator
LVIRGEPGVGKDTLARLIHAGSPRRHHAFIKVNCAKLPVDHQEADLFGQEAGASAPVCRRRLGSFEFAHGGTLYLDEVEHASCSLVRKVLHVVRTGEIARLGGREIIRVDVRLIVATTQSAGASGDGDLWDELRRLGTVEIHVPPLRERPEELPLFAAYFLELFNRRYHRDLQLCPDVLAAFRAHAWPGNIRELEAAMHRLVAGGAKVAQAAQ